MDELFSFEHTEKALREYGERVAAAYREKMRGNEHFTLSPDTLINRVEVIVEKGGASISVALRLADYWKYVEFGTRPHWPPKGALLPWIEAKPILPQPNENGRIPTPEQLDFLIRRKISQEGTKGTHDLAESIAEINEQFLQSISDALAEDIDEFTTAQLRLLMP